VLEIEFVGENIERKLRDDSDFVIGDRDAEAISRVAEAS
jgi:hypothetical protein